MAQGKKIYVTYSLYFHGSVECYRLLRILDLQVFVFVHTDSHQAEVCDSKAAAEQG